MNFFFKLLIVFVLLTPLVFSACTRNANDRSEVVNDNSKEDGFFNKLSPAEIAGYNEAVEKYYDSALLKNGFNGAILVAKNGQVLFEDYKGYINLDTKEIITPQTPFHLASVSKTMTGTTILKLWQDGKLSLNDSLQKFFPAFPYHGVTVRMLLSHRSGLPNYLYFMETTWDKNKKASNLDVLNTLITQKPALVCRSGAKFYYSNTNYVLLALIIEKVTGISYPQYMKQNVFMPLGMSSTYVFTAADTARYVPTYSVTKPFTMDQYDCTYGDKNIYSTPRDLLRWDKALYEHTFVSAATLDSAFTPQSNETPSKHNYGLGWRLYINNTDTLVYHNGKWHGSYNAFSRIVQDTATIIILSNKQNRNVYDARKMSTIFGRDFSSESNGEK